MFMRLRVSFIIIAIVALSGLTACQPGAAEPIVTTTVTPTASPLAVNSSPVATASPSASAAIRQPWPGGQPVEQLDWVKSRVEAIESIYGFTPAGEAWLEGYDMRQMAGQPAWFGSHGYASWAGAGEAVPRSVLHEFGHSYWGAFSVEGRPDLSWQHVDGGISSALSAYHADLEAFMAQPPDRFEPLRDRFRNLPNLNAGAYPDLFHFGEADMLYITGGNFQLVPPVLRKYFSGYLVERGAGPEDGSLSSWDLAMAWFNALNGDDRRIAGELFGIQHFPLATYASLPESGLSGLSASQRTVYETEERQKLADFEAQFAEIIDREFALQDAVGADRGFDFWRGYLSDKLDLHLRYHDVLEGIGTERARQLAGALDYYASISGLSEEKQVESFRRSSDQPLVPELAVLLKPRAIVQLFADTGVSEGVLAVLGSRADRLSGLVQAADRVTEASRQSAQAGAEELEAFITGLPEEQLRSDIYLFLDLLRSGDSSVAALALPAMSDDGILLLLRVAPGAARSPEIGPERLLRAAGITSNSTLEQITAGAKLLADSSSGNFAIDAPYDEALFTHLDRFVVSDAEGALRAVSESGMRLVPWISRDSDGAIRAMSDAPGAAVDLLLGLSGSRETPERIIHLLSRRDAALAAALTQFASQKAGSYLLDRVILTFAYDAYWSERNSGPNVRPSQVAEFFVELSDRLGVDETAALLASAAGELTAGAAAGELEAGGAGELARTLRAAGESGGAFENGRINDLIAKAGIGG
jgi:hypothetical protein